MCPGEFSSSTLARRSASAGSDSVPLRSSTTPRTTSVSTSQTRSPFSSSTSAPSASLTGRASPTRPSRVLLPTTTPRPPNSASDTRGLPSGLSSGPPSTTLSTRTGWLLTLASTTWRISRSRRTSSDRRCRAASSGEFMTNVGGSGSSPRPISPIPRTTWTGRLHAVDDLLPGPLEVDAVVELVAEVGEAEEGLAAGVVEPGQAGERHLQRDGHLPLDLLGAGPGVLGDDLDDGRGRVRVRLDV